jgi:histidinol-phosphate aminotransferase
VVTGCGSDDLLDSIFRASGEPGERVSYVPPTFSMVDIFARASGLEPTPVPGGTTDPSRLLEERPAVAYVCRPNNPTGEVVPRDWVVRLVKAVAPDGPIVLLDEAYADFAEDDFLEEAESSKRLVVLRTFSKAYGLAGLRAGFAVGPPDIVAEIEKARGPYKVSRTAERAAVAALEDRDGWVKEVVEKVRWGREYLRKELDARRLAPLPSGANFILLPLRGMTSAEVTAGLRERGVAVRPFADLPRIGDAIRISIGPRPEIDRFLAALDEVLA